MGIEIIDVDFDGIDVCGAMTLDGKGEYIEAWCVWFEARGARSGARNVGDGKFGGGGLFCEGGPAI